MFVWAMTKYRLLGFDVDWESLINNNINPSEVFEKSDHVQTDFPKSMENRRINTFRKNARDFLIDNHVWINFHSCSATNEELVSCGEHAHCTDQPAVTEISLNAIAGASSIVNELNWSLTAICFWVYPLRFCWFWKTLHWHFTVFIH